MPGLGEVKDRYGAVRQLGSSLYSLILMNPVIKQMIV